MKNFGVADLVLVKPCRLGTEARQRAMRGLEIMEAARAVGDFETALKDADLIVRTSGIDTKSEKRFARISLTPRDFAARVAKMNGRVALLFGRAVPSKWEFHALMGVIRRATKRIQRLERKD